MSATHPAPLSPAALHRRAIVAGLAGNVLEWYDFAVYGYFADTIGRQFFPSEDPTASLLAAFGVFAVGFLMRPVGGVVFGHIGDRVGRKAALTLSVLAMAIPTFLIGVLPGHAQIGAAASVLLVLLRMVQGLSVGGEYTTSVVFLAETAPHGRRGRASSFSTFGATSGVLLGSAVGALTNSVLPPAAVESWGWRLPFLAGLALGVTGLYVRRHVPETAPREAGEGPATSPVLETFRREWPTLLRLIGINALVAVGFYLCFVYLVTYFRDVLHLPSSEALDLNTVNMVVLLLILPTAGVLSDRVGRKPLLILGAGGTLLLAWPLFWLIHHESVLACLLGQMALSVLVGTFIGVIPVTLVEITPARVRCSALSIGYNLCVGVAGGTAPMVATYLIERTHDDLSPAFYLMAAAAISLAVSLRLRETAHEPLT